MMQISAQDEQRFSAWQRSLTLADKRNQSAAEVGEQQRVLREAVQGGPGELAAYLREALGIATNAEIDAPDLPRTLTPPEFRDPTFDLERQIYEGWLGTVTPYEASQPLYWTRCHIRWIEDEALGVQLESALFGALQSGKPMGKEEDAARNLLRRLGGLPHVRGKVSVLNDCPIARAWWRGRIAETAANASHGEIDGETAHHVLHASNDAWSRLVGDSVKRITAINHASVRAAMICQYRGASRGTGGVNAYEMQDAVRLLARHGPPVIFDALDWSELLEISAASVEQAREARARQAQEASEEEDDEPMKPSGIGERVRGLLGSRRS